MDPLQQDHGALRQWLQQNQNFLCHRLSDVSFKIIDMADDILTAKEYKTLTDVVDNHDRIRDLLNIIMGKPSENCKKFVERMLQDPAIAPLLQSSSQSLCHQSVCAEGGSNVVTPMVSHTNTGPVNMDITLRTSSVLKTSGQSDVEKSQKYSACGQTAPPYSLQAQSGIMSSVRACGGSNVFAPVFNHTNVSDNFNVKIRMESGSSEGQGLRKKIPECSIKGSPKLSEEWATSIPNKREFLKDHFSKLVEKVKNVDGIVDELCSRGLHREMASNIWAHPTAEKKMREILRGVTTEKMAEAVGLALCKCQQDVMEELLHSMQA